MVVMVRFMDLWSWWFCGHSHGGHNYGSVVVMVMDVLALVMVVMWSW